ncbi:MAG: hypothetical protein ACI4QT_10950 [Kiritimatiellia bacterium]
MFVFPHTNQADTFMVEHDGGVWGPMSPDEVKAKYPAFATIDLPAEAYYVWSVKV